MARFSLLQRATVLLFLLVCVESAAFTNSEFTGITAGSPFSISWSGDGTPVTIQLLNGPSNALQPIFTIAANTTESPYSWTPSTSLAAGLYALSITQSGTINYSPQFQIAGAAGPTSFSGSLVKSSSTVASLASSVATTSAAASAREDEVAPAQRTVTIMDLVIVTSHVTASSVPGVGARRECGTSTRGWGEAMVVAAMVVLIL
ncbi:MAG: hypothetical protein Q9191_002028 [Dirinaria sp. TL-2023a]